MKIYQIYFWHGAPPSLFGQIQEACYLDETTHAYYFHGTLDEFMEKVDANICVVRRDSEPDILGVTLQTNFGQR